MLVREVDKLCSVYSWLNQLKSYFLSRQWCAARFVLGQSSRPFPPRSWVASAMRLNGFSDFTSDRRAVCRLASLHGTFHSASAMKSWERWIVCQLVRPEDLYGGWMWVRCSCPNSPIFGAMRWISSSEIVHAQKIGKWKLLFFDISTKRRECMYKFDF